jgi:HAD superfamily hydrolase (TIGR01509 family)
MAIRALVFDFDGVVADTEGPEYEAWRATWEEYGHELALDEWVQCIGTNDADGWHPLTELGRRVGEGFDPDEANRRRQARHHPVIRALDTPLPGVAELLAEARHAGLRTAIASSSGDDWVPVLLAQLDLAHHFEHLSLFDGTCPAKPAPDLYLRACAALEVAPAEAIAIEDSPNGVAAAKAAGLWCVAVPHAITRALDVSAADLVLDTLDGVRLGQLQAQLGC